MIRHAALILFLMASVIGCREAPGPRGAESPPTGPEIVKDARGQRNLQKRNSLIAKIVPQYDANDNAEVMPVVGVAEFFDGNADEYSIAPNIVGSGHPGLAEFQRVLSEIRDKPSVQDVLIAIHETPEADDPEDFDIWPDSDTVYVITSASPEELEQWAQPLKFSEVSEGWSGGVKPAAAPPPEPGMRVLKLWWD
jgi:hypothetical protein